MLRAIGLAAFICGALAPAAASADVTVGSSLGDATVSAIQTGSPVVYVQTALVGARLASPVNGTVIAWRVRGTRVSGGPVNDLMLRLLRPTSSGFVGVGHSAAQVLPNNVNDDVLRGPFATSLPIRAGDRLGLAATTNSAVPVASPPSSTFNTYNGFNDGTASGSLAASNTAGELQFNAEVVPTNSFTLSPVQSNRKTGKGTTTATLSNPGSLAVQGRIVRAETLTAAAEGAQQVTLSPSKSGRKRLKKRGKASGPVTFSFTPSFGSPSTQSVTVTLKLKRKHR